MQIYYKLISSQNVLGSNRLCLESIKHKKGGTITGKINFILFAKCMLCAELLRSVDDVAFLS